MEGIVAVIAVQQILSVIAVDRIVARIAMQRIGPAAAEDRVVPGPAMDLNPGTCGQRVEHIVPVTAERALDPGAEIGRHSGTALDEHGIETFAAVDGDIGGIDVEAVITRVAVQPVGPGGADQDVGAAPPARRLALASPSSRSPKAEPVENSRCC